MQFASSFLGIAIVLAGTLGGSAQAQAPRDVEACWRTVSRQLDAFRQGDFDAAYGFASTEIRGLFDRTAFERMVRGGYPEIAHSVSATLAGAEPQVDGRLLLLVRVQGANGRAIEAIYEMIPEAAGWRINGVVSRPAPGVV